MSIVAKRSPISTTASTYINMTPVQKILCLEEMLLRCRCMCPHIPHISDRTTSESHWYHPRTICVMDTAAWRTGLSIVSFVSNCVTNNSTSLRSLYPWLLKSFYFKSKHVFLHFMFLDVFFYFSQNWYLRRIIDINHVKYWFSVKWSNILHFRIVYVVNNLTWTQTITVWSLCTIITKL